MTPERWQQIDSVFSAAAELPASERAGHLDKACGDDAELRTEVMSLLAAEEGAKSSLRGAIDTAVDHINSSTGSLVGERLGAYRIVRSLGEGGMGVVYLAERADAEFSAQVAIKVLHRGGEQAVARFRDERQILAALAHPGIVRLLDSGRTAAGVPYIVMDHVEGAPLTRYARERALSVRERLDLFLQVCAAVQHAHQNLVVHRDLKPSNVLVDRSGRAHLLDFGIAKLLDDKTRESLTRPGSTPLTPEYASPEQARGELVSTATDVYSLGAVLYELLAEAQPIGGTEDPLEQLRRICEVEPQRPSSVAAPGRRSALAGDLDNIVLMALRKDPQRRYPSVEQLAEDIRRHLAGMPVTARPATFRYRAGKLVRRHRAVVAAAALAVVAMAIATVVSLVSAHRVQEHAERAERRFADVRKLAHSLVFEIDEQIRNLPGSSGARETVVARAIEYLDRLAAESDNDPGLERDLALAYIKVGDIQGDDSSPNLGRKADRNASYAKARAILDRLDRHDADTQRVELMWQLGQGFDEEANGQRDSARARLVRAIELAEKLPVDKRDNALLVRAYMTAEQLEVRVGDIAAATKFAIAGTDAARRWRERTNDPEARYWSGITLESRSRLRGHAGDPHGAAEDGFVAIAELEKLAADYPNDVRFEREVYYAYWLTGGFLGGMGDSWQWTATVGDLERSERELRASVERVGRASARDNTGPTKDVRASVEHAGLWSALAEIALRRDPVRGRVELEGVLAAWARVPETDRATPYVVQLEWFAHCLAADDLATRGENAAARAQINEGLAVLAKDKENAFVDERLQCAEYIARAQHTLRDDTAAAATIQTVITTLEPRITARSVEIANYIGLVRALDVRASIVPAEACALRKRQADVWQAWPGPQTRFIREQVAAAPGCNQKLP